MRSWYCPPGVRPSEKKLVGLLFAYKSLLGFGTVLVYLSASELLLSQSPARVLPLAYCAGGAALLAAGWLYARPGARGPRRARAGWGWAAVAALTLGLGGLRALAPTLAPTLALAGAGLVAYRLVALLTHLEFGHLAAAALGGAGPSRRLVSLSAAGGLPAQALGALLALGLGQALPPAAAAYGRLLGALGAYGLALLVRRAALHQQPAAPLLPPGQPLAGRALRRAVGVGLLLLAATGAGAEYFFFVSAQAALADPTTGMRYLGSGLALTYLLAALGSWLFARWGLGWLGVRRALLALPVGALGGVGLVGGLRALYPGSGAPWGYAGGLLLGLELLRQVVLTPTLLLLGQALPPAERAAGYYQLRARYEPLGLAVGGCLLLGLLALPAANWRPSWVLFGGGALLLGGVLLAFRRAYWGYLDELRNGLGLPAAPPARQPAPGSLPADARANEQAVVARLDAPHALLQLYRADAAALLSHAAALLAHPEGRVRHQALRLLGPRAEAALLCQLATTDPDPALRAHASRLACHHPAAADWLRHPDLAVRQGTLAGRLTAAPTDELALASLADLAASPDLGCRRSALALLGWLPPAQQAALLTDSFHGPEPALVEAAERAAAATPSRPRIELLLGLLRSRAVRQPATTSLVRLGAAALPLLRAALAQDTSRPHRQALTQVCARLATPAARQLLLDAAKGDNLPARAAALHALGSLAPVPADMPCFQHLIEEEMQLAQHLLHGLAPASAELRAALRYELREGLRRVLGLLGQVYERAPVGVAQRRALHTGGARQAAALAPLDHLLPRPLYQGLHALLDPGELPEKMQLLSDLLGPPAAAEAVPATIVRRGTAAFSAWTISVALPHWHPQPATVAHLYPHLLAANPLIRASALAVLRQLPQQRPAAYDLLLATHPDLASLLMPTTPGSLPRTSARERVLLLKGTALFADTPENVLSNLVPIMQEVAFEPGQIIFGQGSLGTSLFIVGAGEVAIFDGPRQLITFRAGDFFGELALLDAEARSAAAVAQGPVVALRLDQEDFYDVLEECPEVMRNILQVLCQRLRRQNEQLRPPVPVAK